MSPSDVGNAERSSTGGAVEHSTYHLQYLSDCPDDGGGDGGEGNSIEAATKR